MHIVSTSDYHNLPLGEYDSDNEFGFPDIYPAESCDAETWMKFNKVLSYRGDVSKIGCTFYCVDQQFERVWNTPNKYLPKLKKFSAVLSPDFSTFTNMPKVMQMWNVYRNNWLARFWQENDINVIPSISWGDESSFEWCFLGKPKHSIVAVNTVGSYRANADKLAFERGYNKMLEKLEPEQVLVFSKQILELEGPTKYIMYDDVRRNSW